MILRIDDVISDSKSTSSLIPPGGGMRGGMSGWMCNPFPFFLLLINETFLERNCLLVLLCCETKITSIDFAKQIF